MVAGEVGIATLCRFDPMKENRTVALGTLILIALSGCATLPVNYAPSSTLSASGSVSVDRFEYAPAQNGKVKPNQIRNTAMGKIRLEQNIGLLFHDCVFKELRFVGLKVNDPNRKLTGVIQEFLIDDLGYTADWSLVVTYRVTAGGKTTYEGTKKVERSKTKFVAANVFSVLLKETIKQNIEELIKDPAFLTAVK
jgi:hypothetical protein